MDSVALIRHEGDLERTLREAIGRVGGLRDLKSPCIIKPNLCTDIDVTGAATTNKMFVEKVMKILLEEDEGLAIRIVESDSESKYADQAFDKLGYRELEEGFTDSGYDVSLVNLTQEGTVGFELDGLYFKDPQLLKTLDEDGCFISLAVAKTHSLTLVTGVMKNLFGLLPRKDQAFYHPHINQVIVDLNRLVRQDLCIVDAVTGLEGVLKGRTRRIEAVIAGKKPVSVDATMARVMGFEPERINHLITAVEWGLGELHPEVVGETIEDLVVKFQTPNNLSTEALTPQKQCRD